MKELKMSIVFIFSVWAFTISSFAQETRTYIGFDLGLNMSTPSIEKLEGDDVSKERSKELPQFRLNVTHEFSENVFLKSGVGFISHRIEDTQLNSDIDLKYLELPIQIGYKISMSDKASIGIFGGPYFGWGVGGKIGDIRETFGKKGLDVFNYGAGVGIGLEIQKFAVNLGYNHGIKDISNDYSERAIRLRSVYLAIGFNF